jgi:hypothetical protein
MRLASVKPLWPYVAELKLYLPNRPIFSDSVMVFMVHAATPDMLPATKSEPTGDQE